MGNSRIVKKFRRLLKECEEEHVFRGEIRELNTPIEYAKRLVRRMSVETDDGLHQVWFSRDYRNELNIDYIPLKVDDKVVILGCHNMQKEDETLPRIVLLPKERFMILAREVEPRGWQGGWTGWGQVASIVSAAALGIVSLIMFLYDSRNLAPFDFYSFIPWAVAACIFFYLMIGIDRYSIHSRRGQSVHCSPEDWETVTGEVSKKYSMM